MAVITYESGHDAEESARREFNSCIESIRQGRMSCIKMNRIIKMEDIARHYIKKYGFPPEPLEGALKEGYERLWQDCIRRLEHKAFLEGKLRIYVAQGDYLIPIDKISPLKNLEAKAGDETKEKKPFSHFSPASYKTRAEKMQRNTFQRKII